MFDARPDPEQLRAFGFTPACLAGDWQCQGAYQPQQVFADIVHYWYAVI
jgi:hypothetical protein